MKRLLLPICGPPKPQSTGWQPTPQKRLIAHPTPADTFYQEDQERKALPDHDAWATDFMNPLRIAATLILALSLAGCRATGDQKAESADGSPSVELGKGAGDLAQLEPGEFAKPPDSAQADAQSAASRPTPASKLHPRAAPLKPVQFDYRVLGPPGSDGKLYRATWEGPVELANSKFTWIRLGIAFEVTSQEVADKFKPIADDYRALTDCLKDVIRMRRSPQLQGPEAMEDVKESLVEAVDRFFGATVVRDAYFTQYDLGYR